MRFTVNKNEEHVILKSVLYDFIGHSTFQMRKVLASDKKFKSNHQIFCTR